MRSFMKKVTVVDRWLLGGSVASLVVALMLVGMRLDAAPKTDSDNEEFVRFIDVSAEVYREIRGKYVDDVEGRKVLEAALQGMFTALDEHSQYMDPRTLDSLNKDTGGNFSGIGIHITQRQGLLTVIAPIPGSPSQAVGLLPWDRIIEIEGETTEGMTLQDAVDKLTGPSGTQVTIKVFREGEPEPLEFTITRATIKIESVASQMLESNIAYIRIVRFSESTTADMRRAFLDLKAQGATSLVLDLRFNTGGLLREAIEVSDLFLPKHEIIVSTNGRLKSQKREYRAVEDPIITMPTFVLVNEGSASASEIVAGALQDHKRAVIIGPKGKNTFGKGSVQTIEQLRHSLYDDEDGNPKASAIRLTTARYYTPSGRTIHHIGITPDIGIPLPKNHERDLLRHGLLGDTTIPTTADEQPETPESANPDGTEETPSESIELNEQPAPVTPEEGSEQPEAPKTEGSEPFYSKATKPAIVEDKFEDVMLNEAIKMMKIHMILEAGSGANATKVASAEPAPDTPEAN
ncbi:PDZ domain-containing protein [bacterium]|nr:PDZ domain-containing protein [bacterium]